MSFRLVSANLRWGMTAGQLRTAGQRLGRRSDVFGLQEMRSQASITAVHGGAGDAFDVSPGGQCPQMFRHSRWTVVDHTVVIGTPGVKHITPDLPINRTVYQDKKSGTQHAVYDTHLVPLSLHGKPRSQFKLRRKMWGDHWNMLKRMVKRDVAAGLTVFVVGDFNNIFAGRGKVKEMGSTARWLYKTPLDWIFVVEGSKVRARKRRTFSFRTGSDHKAIGAVVQLSRKKVR